MTYLQNIFVPKSKDSQIWGENGQKMGKKNKESKNFKKYTKALYKSSLLLENQPSSSKSVVTDFELEG